MTLSALPGQTGPRGTPLLHHVERSSSAIGRTEPPRPHTLTRTHPSLASIVEQIADWDVPDGELARATMPKLLPITTPCLVVQYRVPTRSDRHFGSTGYQLRKFRHVVSTIGSGVVTARPSGPLGLIVVRLKPEAAAGLVGCRMQDFINDKINLGDVFSASDVSLLEEMLMEAPDSAARLARIESFLLRNLRQWRPEAPVSRAAQCLRRNPSLRVRELAAQLDIGERHLSRSFRAVFGASPKQFARVARIEKILAMQQAGSAWADIAYACGFADQAHMINDFDAIVGQPPQQFFDAAARDVAWQANARPTFVD